MKNLMTGIAVALLLIAGARAETKPTAQDIVAAMDKARNPGQPFRLTDTLVEYIGGKPRDRPRAGRPRGAGLSGRRELFHR